MFYYNIGSDQWIQGPQMNEGRRKHSSCILSHVLYVCGGRDADNQIVSSIERLVNADIRIDAASDDWEKFQIATWVGICEFLMMPVNAQDILILGNQCNCHEEFQASVINPKKTTGEILTSNLDLGTEFEFHSNQYKISSSGKQFVFLKQESD